MVLEFLRHLVLDLHGWLFLYVGSYLKNESSSTLYMEIDCGEAMTKSILISIPYLYPGAIVTNAIIILFMLIIVLCK